MTHLPEWVIKTIVKKTIKTKVNKQDLIKLKSFCTTKLTISKVEKKKKKTLRMGENNSKGNN